MAAERDDDGSFIRSYTGGRMNGWDAGMNNRHDNVDLRVNELRNAVNVDILKSGKVRMRRGIAQIIADAGAHSIFGAEKFMLWATTTALKKCTPNFAVSTLASSSAYASPLSFVEMFDKSVYFVNEFLNGHVTSLGALEPWGIVPPTVAPVATSLDSGTKDREYQVTVTFVLATGEESGAPTSRKVLCSTTPIIGLSSIPVSLDPRVAYVRIYVSDVDGTMMYKYADIVNGITSYNIYVTYTPTGSVFTGFGQKLETQNMGVMPVGGQLVEYYNGRLYVAKGNIVYFTEPLRYGLHNPVHGYYMFPERVTLLKAVDAGLFVSSDMTYFIDGSPQPTTKGSTVDLKPVLPYKAIEGAHCNMPKTKDVMWLSERGVILGKQDGSATNVTEKRIAMDVAARACMGVLESNGFKGVLTVMRSSTLSPETSDDYIESEVQRLTEVK